MNIIDEHGTFDQVVESANPKIRNVAVKLREVISDLLPDAYEVAWPKQSIVGYGVGPKKQTEHFCYLGLFKNHVNLGFNHGAELSDPDGMLEGSGKKFRHIKIASVEEASETGVKDLIEESIRDRRELLKSGGKDGF